MRRHAKASSAGSSRVTTNSRGLFCLPLVLVAALWALALIPASASAAQALLPDGQFFSSGGSDPGQISNPAHAAVEQSTGNLFVADTGNGRIDVFKADGSFLTSFGEAQLDSPFGIAIAESGGQTQVYVSDSATKKIVRFNSDEAATPTFTLDGTFTSPAEGTGPDKVGNFAAPLAVAPNGDLWVADPGDNRLQRYDATGAYTGSSFDGSTAPAGPFPGGPFTGLLDVAVDSTGRLYVVDSTAPIYQGPNGGGGGQSRVERFAPDGTYQLTLAGLNTPAAVAVDRVTDQVAVAVQAYEPVVNLFDPSGTKLSSIEMGDQSREASIRGLAFASATSRIWTVEGVTYSTGFPVGHEDIKRVRVVTLPEATVAAPASVSYTSANFSGTVDPEGNTTTARFEVSSDAGANWTPLAQFPVCEVTAPGDCEAGPQPVNFSATGLTPATEYRVRLRALVGGGTASSVSPGTQTFTTLPVGAPGILIAAPSAVTGGSAHFSGTINPEAPEAAPTTAAVEAGFKVEWHFECTPECPGLSGGTVAADNSPHAVGADTTGLKPGTAYQVKLVAENAAGPTSAGPKGFTTLVVVPTVQSTDSNPLVSEAHLRALINPEGGATDFHFEYGPTTAYGQSTPTETIPAGIEPVTARSTVVGLAQGTTYHYRVVATNSAGPVQGPDQTFTTQSAPGPENCPNAAVRAEQGVAYLGECRAFEMVSPLDKNGAGVMGNYIGGLYGTPLGTTGGAQLSPDGRALLYSAPSGAFPGSESAPGFARYESFRSGDDWSMKPVDPPITPYYSSLRPWLTFAVSEDGTRAVVYSKEALAPGAVEGANNIYLRDIVNDSYELIVSGPQWGNWSELGAVPFAAATPDLKTIILTAETEWRQGEGLGPVAIKDDGTALPGGGLVSTSGPMTNMNAISPNGKRLLFTAVQGNLEGTGLYLREDGKAPVQVSASQRSGGDPGQLQPYNYKGASRDLSEIFFASPAALTDQSHPGVDSLYRYDVASGELTDLLANASPEGTGFDGRNAYSVVSKDGSSIVFQAEGAFAPGAVPGVPHLYLWRNGDIQLVATSPDLGVGLGAFFQPVQLSSDGRYFAIVSTAKLTSYDNEGPGCGWSLGKYCSEVYVYDADTEALRCASCQPDGEAPKGFAVLRANQLPGLFHEAHVLTDDGKVAFESSDALVPRDVNEKRDVYTWQDGHVELISSGTGHSDALIAGMSEDGSTIAFVTAQQLVRRDTDELQDAYVSRVDGGFASQGAPPAADAACDSSDQCRGAVTTPPPPSKGGSESFESANTKGGRSTVSIVHNRGASSQGALQVAVSGPGKIVVSGKGTKRATKKVAKRGTYPVKVKLQGQALKALHKKGKVTVKVKVQFLPQVGSASTTNAQLTFKRGNSKGGK